MKKTVDEAASLGYGWKVFRFTATLRQCWCKLQFLILQWYSQWFERLISNTNNTLWTFWIYNTNMLQKSSSQAIRQKIQKNTSSTVHNELLKSKIAKKPFIPLIGNFLTPFLPVHFYTIWEECFVFLDNFFGLSTATEFQAEGCRGFFIRYFSTSACAKRV